jgi:hypothetical protein
MMCISRNNSVTTNWKRGKKEEKKKKPDGRAGIKMFSYSLPVPSSHTIIPLASFFLILRMVT